MDMLNDPSMKEVVDEFCSETEELLSTLESQLEDLEDNPADSAKFEEFGQVIDRVMGSASTLGAMQIAKFCELGKVIGYKSSQVEDLKLRNVVVAILFDAIDLLQKMIDQLKTGNDKALATLNTEAFGTRLKWLSDKFKDIDRASVSFSEDDSKEMGQGDIDNLMESLGL